MIELRDYQQHGADGIRASFRAGKNKVLFVGPTGMGKTVLFSYIAYSAAARGNRVTIGAHREELLHQISGALGRFGVHHGLISPQFSPDPRALVQVASVDTLLSRLKKRDFPTDLLIMDEAHHVLPTNKWGKVYDGVRPKRLLGVTASPIRSDGKGLGVVAGGLFEDLIEVITVRELIERGFLVRPVVYVPPSTLDLSGVKVARGDYDRGELAERVDKPQITGSAVEHYAKICPGTPAVVFAVSVAHAEHVASQFQAAGFNFRVVHGSMDSAVRKGIIRSLGNGVDGVVSCDILGEGVDVPAIGCAIFLRPTQSLGLYIQQAGRALRPADGKEFAIILDHVGNTLKHGLLDLEREWTLEGVKRKKRRKKDEQDEDAIKLKQCTSCFVVHSPAPVCPACGHVYPVSSRQLEQVEGELQQITPEMAERMKADKRREVSSARTLDELEAIAKARGYNKTWASHVFTARARKRA